MALTKELPLITGMLERCPLIRFALQGRTAAAQAPAPQKRRGASRAQTEGALLGLRTPGPGLLPQRENPASFT